MRHRHLDYPADTPPAELPSAALIDILDRGDLDDWLPLARAVAAEPNGPLAQRIVPLIEAQPMYGTSALWRAWTERRRLAATDATATTPGTTAIPGRTATPGGEASPASAATPGTAATLGELRRQVGMTQAQVAARLGISQSDVSKLERCRDLKLSTLREFLAALGCPLRLTTWVDGDPVALSPPD